MEINILRRLEPSAATVFTRAEIAAAAAVCYYGNRAKITAREVRTFGACNVAIVEPEAGLFAVAYYLAPGQHTPSEYDIQHAAARAWASVQMTKPARLEVLRVRKSSKGYLIKKVAEYATEF